jgi:hypothetical protein
MTARVGPVAVPARGSEAAELWSIALSDRVGGLECPIADDRREGVSRAGQATESGRVPSLQLGSRTCRSCIERMADHLPGGVIVRLLFSAPVRLAAIL